MEETSLAPLPPAPALRPFWGSLSINERTRPKDLGIPEEEMEIAYAKNEKENRRKKLTAMQSYPWLQSVAVTVKDPEACSSTSRLDLPLACRFLELLALAG